MSCISILAQAGMFQDSKDFFGSLLSGTHSVICISLLIIHKIK